MDPFATLGLPRRYEIDMEQLETQYRELQKALHPDKHAGASASQRKLSLGKAVEVNAAYRTLKDELRRAEALLALHRQGAAEVGLGHAEDNDLLLEVLELREALAEAKAGHDLVCVRALAEKVEGLQRQARVQLVAVFEALELSPVAAELQKASALIGRFKYFRRFLDEVNAVEEEALG
jgi:molecular chaperone HscB